MSLEDIYRSLSDEERSELEILEDPVLWAEVSLKNPEDPTKPFKWRDYQKQLISAQPYQDKIDGEKVLRKRMKVMRCGRQTGKSVTIAVEALYHATTNRFFTILIVTPYESQIKSVFDKMTNLLGDSTFIKPTRATKRPYVLEFANGSQILGFTAGATSSVKGSSVRGQRADLIILDEMDHGVDDIIETVVFPIFTNNMKCRMIISSTPSGRHGLFWNICENYEDYDAYHFHIPSTLIPGWNAHHEKQAKKLAKTKSRYQHEYLAEFGSLEEGVFQNKDLMKIMEDYKYGTLPYRQGYQYFMGVDWNEMFGAAIVILEKHPSSDKIRVWRKLRVERTQFTQLQSVQEVIKWSEDIRLNALYVDHGYGQTQRELLEAHGMNDKTSNLNKILRAIDYGSKLDIRNPETNKKIRVSAKPFMVDNAVYFVENHLLTLPKDEDEKDLLVGALRGFKIKRFSAKDNNPVYECEVEDHELNALFLALLAVTMETTAIAKSAPHAKMSKLFNFHMPRVNSARDVSVEEEKSKVFQRKVTMAIQSALPGTNYERVGPTRRPSRTSMFPSGQSPRSLYRRPKRKNI